MRSTDFANERDRRSFLKLVLNIHIDLTGTIGVNKNFTPIEREEILRVTGAVDRRSAPSNRDFTNRQIRDILQYLGTYGFGDHRFKISDLPNGRNFTDKQVSDILEVIGRSGR
jgi:hypothetical protein